MTNPKPGNGRLKAAIAIVSLAMTVLGMIFWSGYSWAQVSEIDNRVNGIYADFDDHEDRLRAVETAVIRTDGRLENIEGGIEDIKDELRNN